jgi:hypothetical protein
LPLPWRDKVEANERNQMKTPNTSRWQSVVRRLTHCGRLATFLGLWSLEAQSQTYVQEWTQRYDGGNGNDYANAIAVDTNGDVIVTGYSTNNASNYDFVTIKYSSAGVSLWTNFYNGSADGDDRAVASKVDVGGNVIVAGYTKTTNGFTDYVTIAYSCAGVPLWTNCYDGLIHYYDYATAVATDGSRNVFVTGYSSGGTT